jgi:hypothetical protein
LEDNAAFFAGIFRIVSEPSGTGILEIDLQLVKMIFAIIAKNRGLKIFITEPLFN